MQLNVIEDKKGRLVFDVGGMGQTYLNLLKNELWNDEHVKVATYSIRHVHISKPKFVLETDGEQSPNAALSSAIIRLKKIGEKFRNEVKENIK